MGTMDLDLEGRVAGTGEGSAGLGAMGGSTGAGVGAGTCFSISVSLAATRDSASFSRIGEVMGGGS